MIVRPTKVNLSFDTVPSGRTLYLDGIAKTTPFVYDTLVGFNHTIEARNQIAGNTSYTFASWSDGGGQQHTITVPSTPQSYTATFNSTPVPTGLVGAWGFNEGGRHDRDATRRAAATTAPYPAPGVTWDPAGKYGARAGLQRLLGQRDVPHASSLNLSSSYTLGGLGEADRAERLPDDPDQGGDRAAVGTGCRRPATRSAAASPTGAVVSTSSSSPNLPLNQWSHLAAVFNDAANTYTLYLNGTAVPTQSETTAPVPTRRRSSSARPGARAASSAGAA